MITLEMNDEHAALFLAVLAKVEGPASPVLAGYLAQIDRQMPPTCVVCGRDFTQSRAGRRAVYCSRTCAQAAYRVRVRESRKTTTRPRPH